MKNIKSFYIASVGGSGIECESKEEFIRYLCEEIDRIDAEGEFKNFDIVIEPNNE